MTKIFKSVRFAAVMFSAILISSIFFISSATLVSASEINTEKLATKIDDVVKNDKWIEMETELALMNFQNRGVLNLEDQTAYILEKYDGAVASTRQGGVTQRIQNGGWNVYYKTSSGKQTARTAYNGMYVAWYANGGTAAVAAAWAAATGIGWIAGVIFGGIAGVNKHFGDFTKTCRDEIDSHGNTGTARMTLTEARWSSKYDNRW